MKVMVLGASGMIGSAIAEVLNRETTHKVISCGRRHIDKLPGFPEVAEYSAIGDLGDQDVVNELFLTYKPDVVINCAGITKHLASSPEAMVKLNALLPHQLSRLATQFNARLIHISTDCVFSGKKGHYLENDVCDATDLYGRTKALGEISHNEHMTIRTSTIGHEHLTKLGLLEWFLSQHGHCMGYNKAIFSGLTSISLAEIIIHYILPKPHLRGLYHVGGQSIDKASLLKLIAKIYKHSIRIDEDDVFTIDRSFNSDRFYNDTGYHPKRWEAQIMQMKHYKDHRCFQLD